MGYIGNITHLLTIDPNFQRDIQDWKQAAALQGKMCMAFGFISQPTGKRATWSWWKLRMFFHMFRCCADVSFHTIPKTNS